MAVVETGGGVADRLPTDERSAHWHRALVSVLQLPATAHEFDRKRQSKPIYARSRSGDEVEG